MGCASSVEPDAKGRYATQTLAPVFDDNGRCIDYERRRATSIEAGALADTMIANSMEFAEVLRNEDGDSEGSIADEPSPVASALGLKIRIVRANLQHDINGDPNQFEDEVSACAAEKLTHAQLKQYAPVASWIDEVETSYISCDDEPLRSFQLPSGSASGHSLLASHRSASPVARSPPCAHASTVDVPRMPGAIAAPQSPPASAAVR